MVKPVTVVIPCFNQGVYLKDALESLSRCNAELFDLIIVNDGSTDLETISILNELKDRGYQIIDQTNQGLGAARNTGIKATTSRYILPLDADNKILPEYLEKGIEILDSESQVAVVYGNAQLFGDKSGVLIPGKPNLQRMMLGNYIDACALIRRDVIEQVGYYDQLKIMGYEDWDLWLRILFAGYRFHYFDGFLFQYRIRHDSMIRSLRANCKKQNESEQYLLNKYPDQLDFNYAFERMIYLIKKRPFYFIYYVTLKKYFPTLYKNKIEQGKIRAHFIYD
jgi:glycosyltransferase involved in cell wall biosynthesis